MSKIAIVYHSGYGHTARQAEAVHAGAAAAGAEATLYAVDALTDAHWAELAAADAIVFGADHMGSLSAPFAAFWMQFQGLVYRAGRTSSAPVITRRRSRATTDSPVQLAIFGAQQGMLW
jgi:multimeric flavodoxin WrbA